MSTLGWVHLIFGLAAVATGTAVVFSRKGTRYHRTLGHMYFTSMLALNGTALAIYDLTGSFNFFHASALASLTFLLLGMAAVLLRRPKKRWLSRHVHFMSGSYVGLVAALAAEVTGRVPGWDLGVAVGVTTVVIVAIGVYLISIRADDAVANLSSRQHLGETS